MKTIKQMADMCQVSEQAIRGWCRRNQVAKDAKGSYEISEAIEHNIYAYYKVQVAKDVAKDAKAVAKDKDELIWELKSRIERLELERELEGKSLQEKTKIIQKELEARDEQIREKDRQLNAALEMLAENQKLLDQQQQLNAMAEHRIKLLEQKEDDPPATDGQNQPPEAEGKKGFFNRIFRL